MAAGRPTIEAAATTTRTSRTRRTADAATVIAAIIAAPALAVAWRGRGGVLPAEPVVGAQSVGQGKDELARDLIPQTRNARCEAPVRPFIISIFNPQNQINHRYYDLLGLNKATANKKSIAKAYRRAAVKWHPDKCPDNKVGRWVGS